MTEIYGDETKAICRWCGLKIRGKKIWSMMNQAFQHSARTKCGKRNRIY